MRIRTNSTWPRAKHAIAAAALGLLAVVFAPPAQAGEGVIPFGPTEKAILIPGSEWKLTSYWPGDTTRGLSVPVGPDRVEILRNLVGKVGFDFETVPELIEALVAAAGAFGQKVYQVRWHRPSKTVDVLVAPVGLDFDARDPNAVAGTWTYRGMSTQQAGAFWDSLRGKVFNAMARRVAAGSDIEKVEQQEMQEAVLQLMGEYCASGLIWTSDWSTRTVLYDFGFNSKCVRDSGLLYRIAEEELREKEKREASWRGSSTIKWQQGVGK